MKSIYLGIIYLFFSCQNDIEILNFELDNSYSCLAIQDSDQVDTLLVIQNKISIVDQKIENNQIEIIIKTPENYNYLLVNKVSQSWKLNDKESGRIISNDANEIQELSLKIVSDSIEISLENLNKVLLPISKLIDEQLVLEDSSSSIHPPCPPMTLSSITYELKMDSMLLNRQKRIEQFINILSKECIQDSSKMFMQIVVNNDGELVEYKILEPEIPKFKVDKKTIECVQQEIENSSFNFGAMLTNNRMTARQAYSFLLKNIHKPNP